MDIPLFDTWTHLYDINVVLLNTWTHLDSNVEESDRVEVERFQQQDKLNYQLSTKKTELLIINQKLKYHLSTKNLNYQLSTKKRKYKVS